MAWDSSNSQKWASIVDVANQITGATQWVRDQSEQHYLALVDANLGFDDIESPLEAVFIVWHAAAAHTGEIDSEMVGLYRQKEVLVSGERFRLDFAYLVNGDHHQERANKFGIPTPKVAIEVDGHSFHEKTRKQVARRNMRDRLLQAGGWIVLHYSWSEVMSNPLECVRDSYLRATDAFWKWHFSVADLEHPGWRERAKG